MSETNRGGGCSAEDVSFTVGITDVGDGLDHHADPDVYAEDLRLGGGRFMVLCGKTIEPVSMCSPPGPTCRRCREAGQDRGPGTSHRRARRRRGG